MIQLAMTVRESTSVPRKVSRFRARIGIRVLLVEPDERIGKSMLHRFKHSGVTCIWARDAAVAYQLHGEQPDSLTITNVDLPGESGWLVAAKLGLVTGNRVWAFARDCVDRGQLFARAIGIEQFISSSHDPELLIERIGSALENEAGRRSAAQTSLERSLS